MVFRIVNEGPEDLLITAIPRAGDEKPEIIGFRMPSSKEPFSSPLKIPARSTAGLDVAELDSFVITVDPKL
jgi:hypothetical protein